MTERLKFSVTAKDFDVTWFSGTGGGGQHRNKHQNCCRLKHRDTGVIKTGQSHKDRPANQKEALTSMANDPRFKAFCSQKLKELETGKSIEQEVNEMMHPSNLRLDVKDEEGNWKSVDFETLE